MTSHILGFPRIGARREVKRAVEAYWKGDLTQSQLEEAGSQIRQQNWRYQQQAGLDLITVGDFTWYDHILNHSAMLGVVPERFQQPEDQIVSLDTVFRMARGRAPAGEPAAACEMTKWFDTNYHYIVPELHRDQTFRLATHSLFEEVLEAQQLGYAVKPVIPGPVTWLWLSKTKGESFDRLDLLNPLLDVYAEILEKLSDLGVEWVQMDEPALVLDLPSEWQHAFDIAYNRLQNGGPKKLLATYFGALDDNLSQVVNLPVDGLHIDLVRAPDQLEPVLDRLPSYKVLSAGVVDGRNIWRCDLQSVNEQLSGARERLGDRLWVGSSCSLLHSPVDLTLESQLDGELKSWLSFAVQKLDEVALTDRLLVDVTLAGDREALLESSAALQARSQSSRIHNDEVKQRVASISPDTCQRLSSYSQRRIVQQAHLKLPLFPTTTIGSFPQTEEIRRSRRRFKSGQLPDAEYRQQMEAEIRFAIEQQEQLGLDVLVHGEAERNDMVEYFGEQLSGFAFTENGWVQSYGSRCVKPPVIIGDISRKEPMTVDWSRFAQSCTSRLMKGMLTGPVTILCWSFSRDDVPRDVSCRQLALALRDEVKDLEQAGISIIQIDEPAFREGLPLRRAERDAYLNWAVECFRLASAGVLDSTQIHTHMCYAEFNDIISAIADMDADVITIETSRSDMELLEAFKEFKYPNEIGPGVYDIHSPNVPEREWMKALMLKAAQFISPEQLWVNPDCGLKTRGWPETKEALANMVAVAKELRDVHAGQKAG